jgi:hypothetical protein
MIPRFGQFNELEAVAKRQFGEYHTLSSLAIEKEPTGPPPMSAPELTTLLDVVHGIAPDYTIPKHQCYWLALIVYLLVKSRTKGKESNGKHIVKMGTLWGRSPGPSAHEDEPVAEKEFKTAWDRINVSISSSCQLIRS